MSEPEKKDIFRDTWVRYLGYANEVGESFRVQVPVRVVHLSYAVSSLYVAADAVDKTNRVYQRNGRLSARAGFAFADTLIWQALASVMIPGFTINRLCWAAGLGLTRFLPRLPVTARRWTVTAIGLGSIPFIVHPIDAGVHTVLDKTLRRLEPSE